MLNKCSRRDGEAPKAVAKEVTSCRRSESYCSILFVNTLFHCFQVSEYVGEKIPGWVCTKHDQRQFLWQMGNGTHPRKTAGLPVYLLASRLATILRVLWNKLTTTQFLTARVSWIVERNFISWFTGVPCLFHRFDLVADYYSAFQGSLSASDSRAELYKLSLRSVGFLSSLSLII